MKNKNQHPLTKRILTEIKEAIREFGTYAFDDKGPSEVMNTSPLINEFKKLPMNEKLQVVEELKSSDRATQVLIECVGSLETTLPPAEFNQILDAAHEDVKEYFTPY